MSGTNPVKSNETVQQVNMDLLRLRHLHLPNLTAYERASRIQECIVEHHLKNRIGRQGRGNVKRSFEPSSPQVLTFQTPPTYTCGRREIGKLTIAQYQHLRAEGKAEFFEAQRGGQTTFHGPGQLTAYVICNLLTHGLTAKSHVHLLEQSVIDTCKYYGIEAERTENPGVWTKNGDKIASVGVHLRRYITSHGIAMNISPDLIWFDRIVACGLPEKKATSFEREGVKGIEFDNVAKTYVLCLSKLLQGVKGIKEVESQSEEEYALENTKRDRLRRLSDVESITQTLEGMQNNGAEGADEEL